ncbi:Alpha-galactosidase [Pleurostoma richardsiae]|uniref:Alpha-galactosidase n=1 Tax=Pleurostoma richardsiae TaxID=41990 RepID=A0AA38S1T8_9PEZI|nr:Alpha-galactosidase [Pleurostoma richardsiae]
MGWNSYNYYNCFPNESIITENAEGLVSLGLAKLGYIYVTPDCGWDANARDADGRLRWNETLFPSGGGKVLGDFLHGLGLKFGVYSGGGYLQCGSTDLPASLDYEIMDADTFASWGADALKYDNCYPDSPDVMVDYTSPGSTSPSRFQTMADAIDNTSRDTVYQVCQWGVGTDVGKWASKIADSWRISNDIQNNWKSIWRITNEVVPYSKVTKPGAYPDMDMLTVGLRALSLEEERFHFGMWAINKSPLVIGCPMTTSLTPRESLEILANAEVIALNQDSLGEQAQLTRRYTEEEYDIWAGNLSGSRLVVGIANWKNDSQTVSIDLAGELGIASARATDVWASEDIGRIQKSYTAVLAGHQLQLLVLSDVVKASTVWKSAGYYLATNATLSGNAAKYACSNSDDENECLPSHTKVVNIGPGASAASVVVTEVAASSTGGKLLGVDFINYDTALQSAWEGGSNTRNMTISVNGGEPKRWAFPISGGDWYETGRLLVHVDGFEVGGTNTVEFRAVDGGASSWAPDLVGFEMLERAG